MKMKVAMVRPRRWPVDTLASKQQVLGFWQGLLRRELEELGPETPTSSDLNLVYMPRSDQQYVVSLATPTDAENLVGLGEEFVRTHANYFQAEHGQVKHETWCRYLGLNADLGQRRQAVIEMAHRGLLRAGRINLHARAVGGCILKCEYRKVDATQCSRSLDGHGRRNRSLDFETVGYVSFSLEEGNSHDGPRTSKRLKRKRGEITLEYTKVSHLLVAEPHRDRGLGALMLAAVLHRVQCLDPSYAREVFLTVIERNTAAVKLYENLGFRVIGKNATFLGKGKSRPITWLQMHLLHGGYENEIEAEEDNSLADTMPTVTKKRAVVTA
mmetsp:Transcript_64682/g.140903  ORF Transcript_64682/g.140903 Transcript_64682/m.140903 type:complete len:327 (-) Transcript_64682:105-1085(-)|eukprot:CAMPEP_0170629670 /NCGR_PEP_ID=MMETSP0224-20130122/33492_1 /TAXON_ID=285029 /ORGANISM="Togula jolla, Strain CCCM 725" /LENGTH=326 /DNA_ID=CAMNT_0010957479 /DNA_START=97 /DNA_END=1077 /DNA_ORIENTATION=-